jgi:Rap1a immunity proteins
MKTIFALFVIALFATPARAVDTADGNFLLGSCQISLRVMDNPSTTEDVYEAWRDGLCAGLVSGVADVSPLVCAAESVTHGQEVRVVVRFLQDHPERLNLHATRLVEAALAQAFPCSK